MNPGATHRTTWAAWLLAAFGISVAVFFGTTYVEPYQTLTGSLDDGAVDWFTGEGIEAIAWAVVCTSFAFLAHFTVKRSYAKRSDRNGGGRTATDSRRGTGGD